jgi:hypothetical protein
MLIVTDSSAAGPHLPAAAWRRCTQHLRPGCRVRPQGRAARPRERIGRTPAQMGLCQAKGHNRLQAVAALLAKTTEAATAVEFGGGWR